MLFPGLIYLKALDRPRLGGIGNSYIDTYVDFLAREYTHLSLIPGLYDRSRDRRFSDISSEISYWLLWKFWVPDVNLLTLCSFLNDSLKSFAANLTPAKLECFSVVLIHWHILNIIFVRNDCFLVDLGHCINGLCLSFICNSWKSSGNFYSHWNGLATNSPPRGFILQASVKCPNFVGLYPGKFSYFKASFQLWEQIFA